MEMRMDIYGFRNDSVDVWISRNCNESDKKPRKNIRAVTGNNDPTASVLLKKIHNIIVALTREKVKKMGH